VDGLGDGWLGGWLEHNEHNMKVINN